MARGVSFESYGRSMGLSDAQIMEALERAIVDAGPCMGGRFVGLMTIIESDAASRRALEVMRELRSKSS